MINTEIIQFTEEDYKAACVELRSMLELQSEINHKVKKLKAKAIELSGGERMENGIKIQKVHVRGSVDYNRIVKDWEIDEATLEDYRKGATEYWKVTSY